MMRRLLFYFSFILVLAVSMGTAHMVMAAEHTVSNVASEVRLGLHQPGTGRIVVDVEKTAKYDIQQRLQADGTSVLVVQLSNVQWQVSGTAKPLGMFLGYSLVDDVVHVHLKYPVQVAKVFWAPQVNKAGQRLVIDVVKASPSATKTVSPADTGATELINKQKPTGDHDPLAQVINEQAANSDSSNPKTENTKTAVINQEKITKPGKAKGDVDKNEVVRNDGDKSTGEKPIIIIDAGHGGPDPGAISVSGKHEKNITLALARKLKTTLETKGDYKVILTRSKDIFIPLHERVKIGRKAKGQLFISIHADSMGNPLTGGQNTASGASIYTISETASDKQAEALAARENKVDLIQGVDLNQQEPEVANILIDLTQRETRSLSNIFAQFLVQELNEDVRLLDTPLRSAGFAVLKAPDIPSVLIESGFLSNSTDEKLLVSDAYQAKLANGIARAIDAYFLWRRSH